jgi:hypothetical protein
LIPCACAISAAFNSATLNAFRVPTVQPWRPQALSIGAKASAATVHFSACSSGVNLKFALLPAGASVA